MTRLITQLNPRICFLTFAHLVGNLLCCGLVAVMPRTPFIADFRGGVTCLIDTQLRIIVQ